MDKFLALQILRYIVVNLKYHLTRYLILPFKVPLNNVFNSTI